MVEQTEHRWNDGRRFEGRVVFVTGAGGALGGATARAFGREGASVVVAYRSSEDSAMQTAEAIESAGGKPLLAHLDVTDDESVRRAVEDAVRAFGGIDVLVNTAGRIDAADAVRFMDARIDDLRVLFDVDVLGTFRMCQAVAPQMLGRGKGAIVNFSGSYGNGINQDNLVNSVAVGYCTAKGAIRGLTASLARDLAPRIRVNAVSPGPIEANWEDDWEIPAEHVEQALAMTPLKRMGKAEEIAESVLFLASDGAGYLTGQVVQVDGGWIMAG